MTRLVPIWLIALCACGEPAVEIPDAAPEPVAQGGEATADLVVNELSPSGDWIELLNRSDASIDLADFFVTDKADRLDHYEPLAGSLAPGELVVVEPTRFGLAKSDEVHLLTTTGLVVDGLAYLFIDAAPGESLARVPHGEGAFYFAAETPGGEN